VLWRCSDWRRGTLRVPNRSNRGLARMSAAERAVLYLLIPSAPNRYTGSARKDLSGLGRPDRSGAEMYTEPMQLISHVGNHALQLTRGGAASRRYSAVLVERR
jgi:hypothetical protein